MQPLDKTLRNQLDRTVRKARPVAEQAAEAALEQLGVGEENPPSYLSEDQRALRRQLRAHARSLGDPLKDGAQAVTRLIGEIAYEHWHRMLFARFLAENELLMYDDDVAVTLEDCEELAEEEAQLGERTSGWALAAKLASTMLPQVFRVDSPVFELTLAAEYQRELEDLLAGLPAEVFHASDSLGWVYQFWQTDNKERINRSEVKIGADELPAVTQLFTEPYMVSFLLDNSLGAWWAARRLSETDLASAESEQALRDKASLPGVPLEYLRFVKDEDTGHWTPAAGTFDAWPQSLAELKTLDPCCGSGHFLVAALLMLVPMRMELEGLSARDGVDAVLRDNLHGLEIDQRCVELAAFALALTAWRYPGTGGYRKLPELHLACSGLPISANKDEWLDLAGSNTNLRIALEELYKQFKYAPALGSLINPEVSLGKGSLFEMQWEEVSPLLTKALAAEESSLKTEFSVVAFGLLAAGSLLAKKYDLIFTNVPFLGELKQAPLLREFIVSKSSDFKIDLAYAMLSRIIKASSINGIASIVMPMDWLVQTKNKTMRKHLFRNHEISLIAKLGRGAFQYQVGKDVMLLHLKSQPPEGSKVKIIDLSPMKDADAIEASIKKIETATLDQRKIAENKDALIKNYSSEDGETLESYCNVFRGLSTGDSNRFYRMFSEVDQLGDEWEFLRQTSPVDTEFSGMSDIIFWQQEAGELAHLAESLKDKNHAVQSWRRGKPFWGRKGISINRMGSFRSTLYLGERYAETAGAVVPNNEEYLPALWCYFSSETFIKDLKKLTHKLDVEPRYLKLLSFNYKKWKSVSEQKYPQGLPEPYTDDPTQWIFHGHPCGSVVWDEAAKWTTHGPLRTDDTVLQVAVARLLGYRWPAERDPEMELAKEQREWVNRCEALLGHADRDGIVCLPAVRGERRAVDRLEALLADAYSDQWSATTRGKLLESVDHAGKDLESWLRDKFFAQHVKLFQHRPFIWHIWDGLTDGFSALVNYHRLDYKALETLTYTYLGDWITQQKKQVSDSIDGAEARLAAAEALQKSLELILEGEGHPDQDYGYDIFVRWKPLEEQPIGWHPDLNDGVRLNIRPFLSVPDVKKKGAGILRDKPNIHWKKDRGKDVESAPWYHLGPQLGESKGARINDYHLTLAAKRGAKNQVEGK